MQGQGGREGGVVTVTSRYPKTQRMAEEEEEEEEEEEVVVVVEEERGLIKESLINDPCETY